MAKVKLSPNRRTMSKYDADSGALDGNALLTAMTGYWNAAGYSGSGALVNAGTGGSALDLTANGTPVYLAAASLPYMWVPPAQSTSSATAADNAAYAATTGLDVRMAIAADDWTPAAESYPMGQWSSSTAWLFGVGTDGKLKFYMSTNGTTSTGSISSSVAPTVSDGAILGIRAVWAVAGSVIFYTKATTVATAAADMASGSGWTQLGTTVTVNVPTTAPANSTAAVGFGVGLTGSASSLGGKYHYGLVIVDGVTQLNFDPSLANGNSTSWTSAEGRTITLNRPTSAVNKLAIVDRDVFLLDGINDYLSCASSALMDVALADSITAGIVMRVWTPVNAAVVLGKYTSSTGFFISHSTTTHAVNCGVHDGTHFPSAVSSASSSGTLRSQGVVRDTVADNITSYRTATLGTPVNDTDTATSTTAAAFEIGRNASLYASIEFIAAFFARRALNTTELAAIAAVWGL